MKMMIEVKNATKKFKEYRALDSVNLSFEAGKIHGIIGRNGSGKTVLFKCICGFLKLDEGEIFVAGKKIGKELEAPQNAGVIIETPGFLPGYTGYQNLKFLACIHNKIQKKEIREAIQRVGLDPMSRKHVGKYSMGMKQRLGIAQAIMEMPELLILDEPLTGLDNQGAADIRALFLQLREEGKTILLASHSREDIGILCDTVTEMDQGKVLRKSMVQRCSAQTEKPGKTE